MKYFTKSCNWWCFRFPYDHAHNPQLAHGVQGNWTSQTCMMHNSHICASPTEHSNFFASGTLDNSLPAAVSNLHLTFLNFFLEYLYSKSSSVWLSLIWKFSSSNQFHQMYSYFYGSKHLPIRTKSYADFLIQMPRQATSCTWWCTTYSHVLLNCSFLFQ